MGAWCSRVLTTRRRQGRTVYWPALPPGRGRMGSPPSSSGLGSRPFKAETRVRIPLGAREVKYRRSRGVAWFNTPPCQGGDRRFQSGRDRGASGGLEQRSGRPREGHSGEVAQLAEHAAANRGVGSSILPLATSLTWETVFRGSS